jgi:hypothetical protein
MARLAEIIGAHRAEILAVWTDDLGRLSGKRWELVEGQLS